MNFGFSKKIGESHRAHENKSDDGVTGSIVPAADLRNIFRCCDRYEKNRTKKIGKDRNGNRTENERDTAQNRKPFQFAEKQADH